MKAIKNLPGWLQVTLTAGTLYLLVKSLRKDKKTEQQAEVQKAGAVYNLTFTGDRFKQLANQIYGQIKYGIGENKPAFIDILKKLNTNADINQLITEYGTRVNYLYGEPFNSLDLVQNIKAILSPADIDELNKVWRSKNITYSI